MIRPNTIGSVGHFPACEQVTAGSMAFDAWTTPNQRFFSNVISNSEYTPGVNSFSLSTAADLSMPNLKLVAYHMPVPMVPDDSRPGYPFLVSVQGSYCLQLDPSKAIVGLDAFVGYSNSSSVSRQAIKYGTLLPMHKTISDADNFVVEAYLDTTFTTGLPPAHENDTGWHLCIGWLMRTHSGAASIRSSDLVLSSHVLYQNRPCYDPSIS